MKLKELKEIIKSPKLAVFDQRENKVHAFNGESLETIAEIYGEREVEALMPIDISHLSITLA